MREMIEIFTNQKERLEFQTHQGLNKKGQILLERYQ
jgi:hypothetical protein